MEQVVFWLAIAVAVLWTLNWLFFSGMSRGHFWSIIEIMMMWGTIIYFIKNSEISRYHMLWSFPLAFIIGFLLSGIPMRIFRRRIDIEQ